MPAAPATAYKIDGRAKIAISDADALFDGAADVMVSSDAWTADQTTILRWGRQGSIEGVTKGYTGSPVVVLVAQYTVDGTNWFEIGRTAAPATAGSFLIPLQFPLPPDAKQVRIALDATGGTISGSHLFSIDYTKTFLNLAW